MAEEAGAETGRTPQAATVGTGLEMMLPPDTEAEVDAWLRRAADEQVAARLWGRDDTLWGPAGAPEVADRLGWLDAPQTSAGQVEEIERFATECRAAGLAHAIVLGMGGSSLAPDVVRRSLAAAGAPARPGLDLHVLDSVDPDAVLAVERTVDLDRTLFVVSTKSGGTIETLSLAHHFYAAVAERLGAEGAGRRFAAITDPGSPLLDHASERGFGRIFLGDPEIGGRFSALSVFGTVPAALAGADLRALLAAAADAQRLCAPERTGADNLGVRLGVTLGGLAVGGRDKLSVMIHEPLASLGLWLEQLVAESTGKQGRGIVPIVDEPPEAIEAAGEDRALLVIGAEDGPAAERARELATRGHPALVLSADGPADLGRLFFVAELATAVAGWVLEVNPFDQPNVQESKTRTSAVLELGTRADSRSQGAGRAAADGAADRRGGEHAGAVAEPVAAEDAGPIVKDAVAEHAEPAAPVRGLVGGVRPPEYVAILAYAAPSDALDRAAEHLRAAIAEASGAAVTFGYGPRYLHSTGQLHKGGPPTGRFLQLVRTPPPHDIGIPGAGYGFGRLLDAQAEGDLEALRATDRPTARLVLDGDPAAAVEELARALERSR